jgi:hypothetical protein
MEATMADLLHHPHHDTRFVDVPLRVYWAAAIGLVLLALLFAFVATTGSDPAAIGAYRNEPPAPFMPFLPIL